MLVPCRAVTLVPIEKRLWIIYAITFLPGMIVLRVSFSQRLANLVTSKILERIGVISVVVVLI